MQGGQGILGLFYTQVGELKFKTITCSALIAMIYLVVSNSRNLQSVVGDPMYPSGHVHIGLWLATLQVAVAAHGSLITHGLMQDLFSHAEWSGQSLSLEQPAGGGASVVKSAIIQSLYMNKHAWKKIRRNTHAFGMHEVDFRENHQNIYNALHAWN